MVAKLLSLFVAVLVFALVAVLVIDYYGISWPLAAGIIAVCAALGLMAKG